MEGCTESSFKFMIPKLTRLIYELNDNYEKKSECIDLKINTETKILRSLHNAKVFLKIAVFDKDLFIKKEVPFHIEITMAGNFKWDAGMDNGELKVLLESNAPAVLLSYMRPYISNLTAGSGYPPLIIPLLNFRKNKAIYIAEEQEKYGQ